MAGMECAVTATRHILPISGKDSLATAFFQTAREPSLPYEFLFCDVGLELPETYAWLERVEQQTGWKIERVGRNLLEIIHSRGGFLPSPRARYCTREAKIEPMQEWLKGSAARVYYGLRADEVRTGYVPVAGSEIEPVYPLQEAGIDLRGVYSILDAQDLLPPSFFWPILYSAVSERLQSWPGWEGKLNRTERDSLFSGRTRANCSACFFQRRYEFLWLRETHPDLFEQAKHLEDRGYTLQPDYPLTRLDDAGEREHVFRRRVDEVVKLITSRFQSSLFGGLVQDNEIALTSCGLLCGK